MPQLPVFAGLGSEALFSSSTSDRAVRDASTAQGRLLLEACHKIFLAEVSRVIDEEQTSLAIDTDDFRNPRDLVRPCQRYHRNAVIQHASLTAVQLLRYLHMNQQNLRQGLQKEVAVSGFCAGLLSAVAVATSRTLLEYLSHAEECFRLALLIGIKSESLRRRLKVTNGKSPWSVIVHGVEPHEMAEVLSKVGSSEKPSMPIYVSSTIAERCVTLSGEGQMLAAFAKENLPSHCRIKPTNIYGLYHNRDFLSETKFQLEHAFQERRMSFPGLSDLLIPIVSTVDGSLIAGTQASASDSLLSLVLDLTLCEPTDWITVQRTMLELAGKTSEPESEYLEVHNYGPGYGALKNRKDVPDRVNVLDVSLKDTRDVSPNELEQNEVVIVGMGLDLPGAEDAAMLWGKLMEGCNACSEIPSDRFHVEDYYAGLGFKPLNEHRSMNTKFGNFLENPFLFDNAFFGISPREARSMDPQQRLLLQTAYRALENAGYVPDSTASFSRETFGCFIGNATLDYDDNLKDDIDVYYAPGTLRAFLSGRISYAFGWSGPCLTVDTACSSSLVAMYQASRALLAGDCRAALVGGVNVMTSPDMYLGLDRAHFLSPSGQCKSFDQSADGYCRSEGSVAFVLKRLDDAIAENDRILGVIRGLDVNQSGTTHSITHPHSPTQEKLFEKLLARSRIDPHDISVVEAHGTGTQAGDPNEVQSLRSVLCSNRTMGNPLHITSIKANIGHCEAASGGASLAKLLLMLRHQRIPPQPLLSTLNPAIEKLGTDGAAISSHGVPWSTREGKRRTAMLNNFGAAGSNAAVVLQEYIKESSQDIEAPKEPLTYCFGCSAKTEEALLRVKKELVGFLEGEGKTSSIADICYTSTARRQLYKYRLSTTASSVPELVKSLKSADLVQVHEKQCPTVFLFSGQGGQYLGMGKELLHIFPRFAKTVTHCNNLLVEWGMPACLDIILPPAGAQRDSENTDQLQAFQSTIFVLEVALAELLVSFGIKPDIVIGHSLGEYAALVISGVIDLESGLRLVACRARLIVERCKLKSTSMLAVGLSAERALVYLESKENFKNLAVSCDNSPNDCVIGGDIEELQKLKESLSSGDVKSTILDVPIAYHTAALDPVLDELTEIASDVDFSPPTIPIASNVLGRAVGIGERDFFSPQYLRRHCRQTLAFDQGVEDILRTSPGTAHGQWIEIGPHPALLSMIAPRVRGQESIRLPTIRKDSHVSKTFSTILSQFYKTSSKVDFRRAFETLRLRPSVIDLPVMPFHKKEFYVPYRRETSCKEKEDTVRSDFVKTPFAFLSRVVDVSASSEGEATFDTPIHELASYIQGHMVCGFALCPASVYLEMVLSAIRFLGTRGGEDNVYKLSKVHFERPLLFHDNTSSHLRFTIRKEEKRSDMRVFEIVSHDPSDDAAVEQLHCRGVVKLRPLSDVVGKHQKKERILARRKANFSIQHAAQQTFTHKTMYDKIFSRVVKYSKLYHTVQSISLDDAAEEILASCRLPPSEDEGRFAANPVLIDTLLHVAGFAANLNADNEDVYICNEVGSATFLRKKFASGNEFEVHCTNFAAGKDDVIFADAHALDGGGIIAVVKSMRFQRMKLSKMESMFRIASRTSMVEKEKEQHPHQQSSTTRVIKTEESPPSVPQPTSTPPGYVPSVVNLVAETVGVEANQVTPQTDLESLGIDSLMTFELEDKLQQALKTDLDTSDLTGCRTVRDVEDLVTPATTVSPSPQPPLGKDLKRGDVSSHDDVLYSETPDVLSNERTENSESALKPFPSSTAIEQPADLASDALYLLDRRLNISAQPTTIQAPPSTGSHKSPMFLIHPGAGFIYEYQHLTSLDRGVYAIHDPKLLRPSTDTWPSIEAMASQYADLVLDTVRETHPDVPILLGGYSFGGVVALEIARLLLNSNSPGVAGLILIDAPPPLSHRPLSRKIIDAAMTRKHRHSSSSAEDVRKPSAFEEAIAQLAIRNNLRAAGLLASYQPDPLMKGVETVLLRSKEGFSFEVGEGEAQDKETERNEWLCDREYLSNAGIEEWEELVGRRVEIADIPGTHFEPFERENVEAVSEAMRQACGKMDESA